MAKWERPSAFQTAKGAEAEARAQAARGELKGGRVESPDEAAFHRVEFSDVMLDLHGEAQDQAWLTTKYFLDEQAVMGVEGVKIMHGIGTGALKRMLTRELPRHPRVKAIKPSTKPGERDAVILVLFHQVPQRKI